MPFVDDLKQDIENSEESLEISHYNIHRWESKLAYLHELKEHAKSVTFKADIDQQIKLYNSMIRRERDEEVPKMEARLKELQACLESYATKLRLL